MKKLRRFVVIVISMLIIVWGISHENEVRASSGDTEILNELTQNPYINMNIEYYGNSDNLFCVEQHQELNNGNAIKYYPAMYYIELKGKDLGLYSIYGNGYNVDYDINGTYEAGMQGPIMSEEEKQIRMENTKMAYILAQNNDSDKANGPVQNAIWYRFATWFHHRGLRFGGFSDGSGVISKYLDEIVIAYDELGRTVRFETNKSDDTDVNDAGKRLAKEAEKYANELFNGNSQIDDNSNIKTISIDDNFVQIGPFNWTYPGNLNSIFARVGTGTNNIIEDFYNAYGYKRIESGKDFYIKVHKDNIKNGGTLKVGGTAKVKEQSVKIYFFVANENDGNHYQNLIYIKKQDEGSEYDITSEFTYELEPLVGKLQIHKSDSNGIQRDFSGIGFKIHSQVKGGNDGYLKLNGNEIIYTNWNDATQFETDKNGYTEVIKKLPIGKYTVYETKIPDELKYIYTLPKGWIEQGTVVIKEGTSVTPFTATNTQAFGSLKIKKKDYNNIARNFSGIGFKIKNSNNEWLIIDSNGDVTGTTTNEQYATLLEIPSYSGDTDLAETKVINKVPLGTYTIYERSLGSLGNIYKIDDTNSVTVTINSNNASEVLEVGPYINPQVYSDFRILKIDKHTKKPIAGIGFKIYSKAEKKWVVYKNGVVTYSYYFDGTNGATEFVTRANGYTDFIESLPLGYYDIYETNLGTHGDIYELDENSKVPGTTGKVKATLVKENYKLEASKNAKVTIPLQNEQKYVKLSGRVWLDWWEGKNSPRNDIYDSDDYTFSNVKVRLKTTDTNQTVVDNTGEARELDGLGSDGKYVFNKVLVEELSKYYIEFEYNGLGYTTVIPYNEITDQKIINNQNIDLEKVGSKAKESDSEREKFNDGFSVIEGGEDKNGKKGSNLGYTKDSNGNKVNNLKYNNTSNTKVAVLENRYNKGYYVMNADTNNVGLNLEDKFNYGSPATNTEGEIPKVTEISNINLGLYEREQPDIAIVQDIQNVFVKINGHEHRYDYNYRFADIEANEDRYEVSVKDKYYRTYIRVMYQADREFKNGGVNELEAYITYKITIRNQATTLTTVINGLDYYFDSNYEIAGNNNSEIVGIGSELDGYDNISNLNNDMQFETVSNYGSGRRYKKTKINNENGIIVEAGKEKNIFIKFKLNRTALINIINNDENLDSVAEIHSYSVKSGGKAYAGIDKDSNPNNCVPTKPDDFEDDTDWAPGLKIKLEEKRTTSGTVFIDETNGSLMSGRMRNGNGKFDFKYEKGVKDVEVTMYEADGTVAKIYDEVNEVWKEAKTTTDENGNYTIGGYIPGEYYIVYTWGDKTYKVQDYKGTIQVVDIETLNPNDKKEWYKDKTTRYSDAQDDWNLRLRIDDQTKIMTNDNKEAINSYTDGGQLSEVDEGVSKDLITKMQSKTPVFRVNLEYNTGTTKNSDEYELNEDGSIKLNGIYVVKKEKYRNEIQNIDFGIIERARQILKLEKNIKSVKVTLTDVSVLVNAKINDNGTIENKPKYVTYVRKSDSAEALFKLEVDQEIIQNAKLEVEYELKVTNKSEVDYNNMYYYLYGKVPQSELAKRNQVVSLKPEQIVDYLDKNLVSDDSNENWQEIQTADRITALGLSEEASENAKTSLKNGIVKVLKNQLNGDGLKPISGYNNCRIILKCNKLLTVKDEEIPENHAEIIRVRKDYGATLKTTPGNYIPNKSVLKADNKTYYNPTSELDNSNSGSIQIIPPTGLNKDIIAFTILAISSLGILTTGIILIKKYAL